VQSAFVELALSGVPIEADFSNFNSGGSIDRHDVVAKTQHSLLVLQILNSFALSPRLKDPQSIQNAWFL